MPSAEPILFGMPWSIYTRIARLALAEKSVPYRLQETDVFAGHDETYRARHPFNRIPALEHAGFRLYESGAIVRYIDEAFDGLKLQPDDLHRRARMNQIIAILDSYAFRCWVWDIFVERVRKPINGKMPDEAKILGALPLAETCLATIEGFMQDGPFLTGATLSLADTHAAPMAEYLSHAAEGRVLLEKHKPFAAWLARTRERPSMIATRPPRSFTGAGD